MKRERSEMLGDFLREAAVLIVVFLPLERYLRGGWDWDVLIIAMVIAGPLLWFGMILEGRNEV